MALAAQILVALIALEHFGFLTIEMFLWTKPLGKKFFRIDDAFAKSTAALAANQGLYNGFLTAGLIWGLVHPDPAFGRQIQIFFLSCVTAAGAYCAYSIAKTGFLVQSVPALLALALLFGPS